MSMRLEILIEQCINYHKTRSERRIQWKYALVRVIKCLVEYISLIKIFSFLFRLQKEIFTNVYDINKVFSTLFLFIGSVICEDDEK